MNVELPTFGCAFRSIWKLYYRDQATNQDLQAQKDMAFWAATIFGLGIFQTGLSAAGIWFVVLNLREARKVTAQSLAATNAAVEANRLSHEQFIADQRAWIEIKSVTVGSPLTWNQATKEGRITVVIKVKNVGPTLAKNVWFDVKLTADVFAHPLEQYRDFAAQAKLMPPFLGYSLFNGNEWVQSYEVPIVDIDKYAEVVKHDPWTDDVHVSTRLLVCVSYSLVVAERRQQVGGILELQRTTTGAATGIGPKRGDVPANELVFKRSMLGDFIAD